jgi:hypothetical protein
LYLVWGWPDAAYVHHLELTMRTIVPLIVVFFMSAFSAGTSSSQTKATRDSMTGVWCGTAKIVVSWTTQRNLGVRLIVPPSGEITGQVGDARLAGGRLEQNRGSVGRMLNVKTDYIIIGKLEGPIIASEKITRSEVKMPLNWTGSEFRGGVNTGGWKFGGKDHMVLAASRLVLRRWIAPVNHAVRGAC